MENIINVTLELEAYMPTEYRPLNSKSIAPDLLGWLTDLPIIDLPERLGDEYVHEDISNPQLLTHKQHLYLPKNRHNPTIKLNISVMPIASKKAEGDNYHFRQAWIGPKALYDMKSTADYIVSHLVEKGESLL